MLENRSNSMAANPFLHTAAVNRCYMTTEDIDNWGHLGVAAFKVSLSVCLRLDSQIHPNLYVTKTFLKLTRTEKTLFSDEDRALC